MNSTTRDSAAKIKRGNTSPRKPRAVVKKRKATPKGPSRLDQLLAILRITPAMIHRATMLAIFAALAGVIGLTAIKLGIPQLIAGQFSDAVSRAGFNVKNVEIIGLEHMDRTTVYNIALDQHSASMASVDLSGVRQKLLGYGWVKDAAVSRRLPDTLVIDLTERKAAAVWQNQGQLNLVDGSGVVLEPVTPQNMPSDVPLIIGPDANSQATALTALLAKAPRLKPLIAGAAWIGNRRWDLRFQTGEVLSLPEGADAAAKALSSFAEKDAAHPLLGKGYLRFDVRDGEHIYIRVATPTTPDKRKSITSPAEVGAQRPATGVGNG